MSAADKKEYIFRPDWADDVKDALNDFIACSGKDAPDYDGSVYAVFDFDNTAAVFDVEDQLLIYQLRHMAFGLAPNELRTALSASLPDRDRDLTELGYGRGSFNDWMTDITGAYTYLWDRFGPFTPAGLSEADAMALEQEPMWLEFAAKMRCLYDLVNAAFSAEAAYPWVNYWFTGMTPQQVYELAFASHMYYMNVETKAVTWVSPAGLDSRVGSVSCTWTSGIQVTENIKELMGALSENGIDVWICSASFTDVIRAGIDAFGLHGSITGLLAMTGTTDCSGRYKSEYDFVSGCGWLCGENGTWVRDTLPTCAQTQSSGKVTAIENTLFRKYGHGPAAGFMDSTGDFNFCTEFDSLKLVVCFNRADRGVRDGGGLIAALAMYQRDTLGYDLAAANSAGDTLYVLQGRDENGRRAFHRSNATLLIGSGTQRLFKNDENSALLEYLSDSRLGTGDILNRFSVRTAAEDPDNPLGFEYGFLSDYAGYHSHL